MRKRFSSLFNPERFHGWNKTRSFFEGWYFKMVSTKGRTLAFIPGIAWDQHGQGHTFIQFLDGNKKESQYHRFSTEQFRAAPERFLVTIGGNVFSSDAVALNLDGIQGSVQFHNTIGWPKPWYAPGIMGPFSFVPFMECYHGIVSMDHEISGELAINGENIDMNGGRGYLEKDWGSSFPSAYTWMQSNHFEEPGISIKCSVARIPWLGSSFTGFICGLWLKDRLIRFTTYNRSRLKTCRIGMEQVSIELEHPDYRLSILAHRDQPTTLAAPIQGAMEGRIQETMQAKLQVHLVERTTNLVVFDGLGKFAGLEVAGAIERIETGKSKPTPRD